MIGFVCATQCIVDVHSTHQYDPIAQFGFCAAPAFLGLWVWINGDFGCTKEYFVTAYVF